MNKLIAGAALGAMLLGAVPSQASADPLTPTVEGQGYFDSQGIPDSNTVVVEWGCAAATTGLPVGAVPQGTTVTCHFLVGGVEVDRSWNTSPGAAAATAPQWYIGQADRMQVCWEAGTTFSNGATATDTTLPNCVG